MALPYPEPPGTAPFRRLSATIMQRIGQVCRASASRAGILKRHIEIHAGFEPNSLRFSPPDLIDPGRTRSMRRLMIHERRILFWTSQRGTIYAFAVVKPSHVACFCIQAEFRSGM